MTLIVDISYQKSDKSRRIVLEDRDELLVGRLNDQVLLTADPRMSRRHFLIRHADGEIQLEHLSKTNPTLLASENSSDFRPISGQQTQMHSCRIIAGFHRFVLTIERAETIQHSPVPEFDAITSWGDVDDEPAPQQGPVSANRITCSDADDRAPFRFDDSVDEGQAIASVNRKHPPATPNRFFDSEESPASNATPSHSFTSRDAVSTDTDDAAEDPPPRSATSSADADENVNRNESHADQPAPAERPKSPPRPERETAPERSFIDFADSESVVEDDDASRFDRPKNSGSTPPKKKDDQPQDDFPKKMNFPIADSFFDD